MALMVLLFLLENLKCDCNNRAYHKPRKAKKKLMKQPKIQIFFKFPTKIKFFAYFITFPFKCLPVVKLLITLVVKDLAGFMDRLFNSKVL